MLLNSTSIAFGIFVEKSSMYVSQSPSYVVAKKQLRVVVHEHETHVVQRADLVRALEVAAQHLQQAAEPLAPPGANFMIAVSSDTLP